MLIRTGYFDKDALIDSLKSYLPLYGKQDRQELEIPYREGSTGRVQYGKFQWLTDHWEFLGVRVK